MTEPGTHAVDPETESFLGLLRRLSNDVIELLSNEFELVRSECVGALSAIARSLTSVALAIATCIAGAVAMTAAIILVLMHWLAPWLAAAITGIALLMCGALLIRHARQLLKSDDILLVRTRRSLHEDVEVAKGKSHDRT